MSNRKAIFILIMVISLGVISNIIWISADTIIDREEAIGLIRSADYRNILKSDMSLAEKFKSIFSRDPQKPHYSALYYLLPAIFPVGRDLYADFARMLNAVYLIILLVFVYKISYYLFQDRRAAVLSSYVMLCAPIAFSLSRWFMPSIAVMSLTAVCVYLLLVSDELNKPFYSMLFLVFFIIGSVMANYFLYYFIFPLAFIFVKKAVDFKKWKFDIITISFFILMSLFFLVFLKYYARYAFSLLRAITIKENYYNLLIFITKVFINRQVYLLYFIFLLIGIYFAFRFFDKNTRMLFIFLGGMALTFLLVNKAYFDSLKRFTAPYAVFYAIFISFWIFKIKNGKVRKSLALFLIFASAFIFVKSGFGFLDKFAGERCYIKCKGGIDFCVFDHVTWSETRPMAQDWHCREIAELLIKEDKKEGGRILIVPDIDGLNANIISYYMHINEYPLNLLYFWNYAENYYLTLFDSGYIFIKSGASIKNVWGNNKHNSLRLENFMNNPPKVFLSNFTLLEAYNLPDGSVGRLYKRRGTGLLGRPVRERLEILREAADFNPDSKAVKSLLKKR